MEDNAVDFRGMCMEKKFSTKSDASDHLNPWFSKDKVMCPFFISIMCGRTEIVKVYADFIDINVINKDGINGYWVAAFYN